MDIFKLLQLTIERNASDLHMVTSYYPTVRIDGMLYPITTLPVLTRELSEKILFSMLTAEQKENLLANKEIDLGYEYNGNRFRVNIYYTKGGLSGSFRLIPPKILTLEELNIPPTFHKFGDYNSGLVLLTGPTGEGKSTTLASIIEQINQKYSKHIITIEDPIEFIYPKAKALVSQRELHSDTHSWNVALRSVLREDPDVVLVGEMRDFESTALVLTIAETGHLVFSTLHTSSTPESINRIIDIFPAQQQNQIRAQLAGVLRAVVSQRLLPRADAKGRIPAFEVLYNSSAVASIIRDGKSFLLDNVLQTSESEGFIYFEKYLVQLYSQGKITRQVAEAYSIRPKDLAKYLR